jgi:hypothetical protein
MPVTLCVLLSAMPGNESALIAYEDQVLPLVAAHDGRILQRVRAQDPASEPFEVHVIEFPTEPALAAYMDDPRRRALSGERDAAIASTHVLRVDVISAPPH